MSTKRTHMSGGQMLDRGFPPFRSYSENVGLRVQPERCVRGEWNKEELKNMERLRREKVGRVGYRKGGEDGEGRNDDGQGNNRIKGWVNWGKWSLCICFVLFNLLIAFPLSYLIAKYTVSSPWQWITFILSHHAILAVSYETTMNIRDGIIREEEDKMELERWDRVIGKLEIALRDSRQARLVLGRVENGLRGREGEERRSRGEGGE